MELIPAVVLATTLALATAVDARDIKLVTYWPDYRGTQLPVDTPRSLSHVFVGFAIPQSGSDLSLQLPDHELLKTTVNALHSRSLNAGLLVGGWNAGDDSGFGNATKSEEARDALTRLLINTVDKYGLDAIELDWEFPDNEQQAHEFSLLIQSLRDALDERAVTLSLSVPALGAHADVFSDALLNTVDWVSVMAYDGPPSGHASRTYFSRSLAYWRGRNLPAAKIVMGMPAYSRPNVLTYRELVQHDPANALVDHNKRDSNDGDTNWNGLLTASWKAGWALQCAGGLALWEWSQDVDGPYSLLQAASATFQLEDDNIGESVLTPIHCTSEQ